MVAPAERRKQILGEIRDPKEQVVMLTEGQDATQLELSAAEGYLLSRIDGVTPWRLLREIGGIPPADVDACLSRWLEEGILDVVGGKPSSDSPGSESTSEAQAGSDVPPTQSAPHERAGDPDPMDAASVPDEPPPAIDEGALDDALDISVEVQRRILEYEASLGRPYHELLNVAVGAPPKAVKHAYFKLSKEFHPDRYFRKEIGGYGARLDRIFKKVLEAHEILSDPELCKVENQAPPPEATEAPGVDAATAPPKPTKTSTVPPPAKEFAAPSAPKVLTKLERLRQRMPFKINHAAIAERRARADEIFRAAEYSQQAGRLNEAEASIRIAISFDPARSEFKEALGSLRIAAAGERAKKLLASPSDRMSDTELREALTLLEDVLPYRPHDPELNERAARVCLELKKFELALEYAETLLERMPEYAPGHTLTGRIFKGQGDLERAASAFETALKYDEEDLDARRALASLRIGARDLARGGQQ